MIDHAYHIPDARAVELVFQLLEEEGLCLGASSGVNVAGAIDLAREMGPGHTIATVLCDFGSRYQSKLFNPAFLREKRPARAGLAGPIIEPAFPPYSKTMTNKERCPT